MHTNFNNVINKTCNSYSAIIIIINVQCFMLTYTKINKNNNIRTKSEEIYIKKEM